MAIEPRGGLAPPAFKKPPKPNGAYNPSAFRERMVLAHLFVFRTQDLAGLRVHQMRLSAREAGHLNVSEVIVFGVISGPSLDDVASVGATIQKRRHDPALLFFLAVLE